MPAGSSFAEFILMPVESRFDILPISTSALPADFKDLSAGTFVFILKSGASCLDIPKVNIIPIPY
jgi:hypothetical protein